MTPTHLFLLAVALLALFGVGWLLAFLVGHAIQAGRNRAIVRSIRALRRRPLD